MASVSIGDSSWGTPYQWIISSVPVAQDVTVDPSLVWFVSAFWDIIEVTWVPDETHCISLMTHSGVIKNIWVVTTTAQPWDWNLTVHVRKNGVNQISIPILAWSVPSDYTNLIDSFSFWLLDKITVSIVNESLSPSATIQCRLFPMYAI